MHFQRKSENDYNYREMIISPATGSTQSSVFYHVNMHLFLTNIINTVDTTMTNHFMRIETKQKPSRKQIAKHLGGQDS